MTECVRFTELNNDSRRHLMQPTARELQVLVAIIETGSGAAAAVRLGISRKTIDIHLAHARRKLGAASTGQAFALACARGLIDPFTLRFVA
jgi:DNA-binding CsgD family transcriptional regulator